MPQRNRKSEQIRRANRVIQSRSFILMLVMGVLLFVVLFFKLYQLQIGRHDELQKKAINQQVRSTVVTASRGTIYDASGNILAISSTAETVFLDPNAIDKALSDTEKPVAWTRELIAQRLGEILGISEDSILEKMERTYSQYEVLKLRVDEDVANEVRSFINEYSVKGIYLSPDAKRYYPYGTLASQVIGFVGTDNTGLYGLEAQYEDQLEGQTGLVVTARDNAGNDLLYEYEQYHAAQNGSNLVLTLDATVQYYLEKGIEETGAINFVAGMILDYRAFDTFGESTVLFVAACSVLLLLKLGDHAPGEKPTPALLEAEWDDRHHEPKNDAILQLAAKILVPVILLYGMYIVLNGHLSPGGGFSGGAVMGAGLILYLNAFGFQKTKRFFTYRTFRWITFLALMTYAALKSYSFYTGANHIESGIPLGTPGAILSSGFILPLNICVGLIVMCTMYAFYTLFRKGGM